MKRLAVSCFAGVLLLAFGSSSVVAAGPTKVSAGDTTKPAAVPLDYVVTPFGYFHPSCAQKINPGEQLRKDGSIQLANGGIRKVAACAYPSFLRDGTRVDPTDFANARVRQPSIYNGYLQLISAVVDTGVNDFTATMTVPGNPTLKANQTIYLFPGLEDANNVITILQPVLGWNGFGDKTWTLTSWNCCESGTTYYGNTIPVQPGDVIFGSMSNTGGDNWNVSGVDQNNPGAGTATLDTQGYGQSFNWVFAGALETYGIGVCKQFPSSGPVTFASVTPYINSDVVSDPNWTVQAGSAIVTKCSSAAVVDSTTATISFK